MNNSQNLSDLRILPSNRLKKLKEKGKDFYSIRMNDKWRIIFQLEIRQNSGLVFRMTMTSKKNPTAIMKVPYLNKFLPKNARI